MHSFHSFALQYNSCGLEWNCVYLSAFPSQQRAPFLYCLTMRCSAHFHLFTKCAPMRMSIVSRSNRPNQNRRRIGRNGWKIFRFRRFIEPTVSCYSSAIFDRWFSLVFKPSIKHFLLLLRDWIFNFEIFNCHFVS